MSIPRDTLEILISARANATRVTMSSGGMRAIYDELVLRECGRNV